MMKHEIRSCICTIKFKACSTSRPLLGVELSRGVFFCVLMRLHCLKIKRFSLAGVLALPVSQVFKFALLSFALCRMHELKRIM